jgi:hypothetical protein
MLEPPNDTSQYDELTYSTRTYQPKTGRVLAGSDDKSGHV